MKENNKLKRIYVRNIIILSVFAIISIVITIIILGVNITNLILSLGAGLLIGLIAVRCLDTRKEELIIYLTIIGASTTILAVIFAMLSNFNPSATIALGITGFLIGFVIAEIIRAEGKEKEEFIIMVFFLIFMFIGWGIADLTQFPGLDLILGAIGALIGGFIGLGIVKLVKRKK